MIKTSASDGDGDETVRSELSRGGYITEYDEVALTNYLLHLPSYNDFILEIDVEEELNQRGDGGNLDDDGDNVRDFDYTMREVKLKRSHFVLVDYGIEKDGEGQMKSMLIHVGYTMDPDEVKVPK